jgi:hypothetical protein
MQNELQLQVSPETAAHIKSLKRAVANKSGIPKEEIRHIEILKKSIDARKLPVKINLRLKVYINEDFENIPIALPNYQDVSNAKKVIIIGAGPAGLFAALQCIENGIKPIILERGKEVAERGKDLQDLNVRHMVNEDSNYCFGEGGAGTYSDGKLYTRSKKRGDVDRILELLVGFGADKNIMVNAHPHIGTNKLPAIITKIRKLIIEYGGEVHFNNRVTDIVIKNNEVKGIQTSNGEIFNADKVILATGHSARDIYTLLHQKGILIESKTFAIGIRVEHPQTLIDQIQYKCRTDRGPYLPPAPYNIVKQVNGRGVYSFCMCPGGVIAPCATSPGEIVTNGWSPSKRDMPTANSGIVVELRPEDFIKYEKFGPLAAMEFQKSIEQAAWREAGRTQKAPAQKLYDFINGRLSGELPLTSYKPGVTSVDLRSIFPPFIYNNLSKGLIKIGNAMQGYLTNEAVVHAPESRTSSPVRIPRDRETLEHIQIKGLYPCGEGAGYAGGIISAAIDGEKCAAQCVATMS